MDDEDIEDHSFALSFSDLMSSLLFIFIIILVYHIIEFSKSESKNSVLFDKLTSVQKTRSIILREMFDELESAGVKVTIDTLSGLLRLNENAIRFEKNQSELDSLNLSRLLVVSSVVSNIIKCHSKSHHPLCNKATEHFLESVFIEGHTDSVGTSMHNRALSAERSVYTYNRLMDFDALFSQYANKSGEAILSMSAYGEDRPIKGQDDISVNRRIDFRIIMEAPSMESQN